MHRRIILGCLSLLLVALTIGCERQGEPTGQQEADESERQETDREPDEQNESEQAEQAQTDENESDQPTGDARTITIEPVDNEMRYEQTEITAEAGEQIRIVFDNTATDEAMKHNVVVLNTDESDTAMEVAQAGWKIPDQEYVPDHEAVLAHTPMSDPGETVDVTFTAPEEPGEYTYICTYPGHYPSMKGTLVVE